MTNILNTQNISDHARDLKYCINNIYIPAGIEMTNEPIRDMNPKNEEYGAYLLELDNKKVLFRIAKVTNDRPGAFVTVWKRCKETNNIVPFDCEDCIDYLFVLVKGYSENNGKYYRGQFFFDKTVLLTKNVFSKSDIKGKLAMRVFPPWSQELAEESIQNNVNKGIMIKKTQKMTESAKRTQVWQSKYYVSFNDESKTDFDRIKNLFFKTH